VSGEIDLMVLIGGAEVRAAIQWEPPPFFQPLALLPLDSSPLQLTTNQHHQIYLTTHCLPYIRPPELAALHTHLEDGNCNVCQDIGQHQTFDAALTQKPKLYIALQLRKPTDKKGI
jgi:hypothetical protein